MNSSPNASSAVKALYRNLPEGSLRVLQITDTHLYGQSHGELLGLNTGDTLDQVLELVRDCEVEPDFILATGDLVHDASEAGYARFREAMLPFGRPVFCLPGNHDLPEVMSHCLASPPVQAVDEIQVGDWLVVLLDSTIRNQTGGRCGKEELSRLREVLTENRDTHTLVSLHHHPLPVGSRWMDTMALENGPELFAILDDQPQVHGLLWGHIHQEYDRMRGGIRLLGSPSTCIQFTPGKDDFGVDDDPPGCRWLALLPDGGIRTCVTRLAQAPAGLDRASVGY